jgi:perosamine synthetase
MEHIKTKTKKTKKIIPWAQPTFFGNEGDYLLDALNSTWVSGGKYVDKFEEELSSYCGSKYGITVSNGTTALHLALLALDIGPGDEVIVPGFTFVAVANTVLQTGATPVFCDIDAKTWCIDVNSIKNCVSDKTKAIIPVHIYGNVCDIDNIKKIADAHNLFVIEDTAEAAFSRYNGRYAGSIGDLGCFSFQATKTITTGEGGIVLTNNQEWKDKMRIIRSHGMRPGKRYWHDVIGYNYRLTNLQAALGCAQLENLNEIIIRRKKVYELYKKILSGRKEIILQEFNKKVIPVLWTTAFRIEEKYISKSRDQIIKELHDLGIETRPGFYPFSLMPIYKANPLPIAEKIGRNIISLPTYPSLDDETINYICDQLYQVLGI